MHSPSGGNADRPFNDGPDNSFKRKRSLFVLETSAAHLLWLVRPEQTIIKLAKSLGRGLEVRLAGFYGAASKFRE